MADVNDMIRLFAFDLDGTIYVGERLVDGAAAVIDSLSKDYKIVFFTNNSAKTIKEVHEKLRRLGITCEKEQIYTSAYATAEYLLETGVNDLYVIGSDSFRNELLSKGLRVVPEDAAKSLVVGLDPEFNYEKLSAALNILIKGGKFIACNEDARFPVGDGMYRPGCGAMVGAIAAASGKKPDFVVGKPNTYILSRISGDFCVRNDEIMVVGDSYESDIAMALSCDCHAVLLSGGSRRINRDDRVMVIQNIAEILHYMRRGK